MTSSTTISLSKGVTIHNINGEEYHIFQARLKDVMHTDGKVNPILWFAQDIKTRDFPVCGVPTQREALQFLKSL